MVPPHEVEERRLRVADVRPDEPLVALVARTASTWSVDETPVANALGADARLAGGTPVKVPGRERYRPPLGG